MNGNYDSELTNDNFLSNKLETVGSESKSKIFNNEKILKMEVAGFNILGGLLEVYCDAVVDPDEDLNKKILKLLPQQFKPNEEDSTYYKFLKVSDFVCRMTDNYAIELYKKIHGQSLPIID